MYQVDYYNHVMVVVVVVLDTYSVVELKVEDEKDDDIRVEQIEQVVPVFESFINKEIRQRFKFLIIPILVEYYVV
jgi:hypothetical protein